jgi:hypothetical protein
MNTMLKNISGTTLLLLAATFASAQQKEPYRLGSPSGLLQDLKTQAVTPHARLVSAAELKVGSGVSYTGKVNARHTSATEETVIGEIEKVPGSSFFLSVKDGAVQGAIIFRSTKKGYKYYTDKGTAYVKEVPLDSLLCIEYNSAPDEAGGRVATGGVSVQALPELQSLPGANGVILLDFDGQYVVSSYWNSGNPINAAPSTLNDEQQREAWEMISEDFRPFNLNITNSEAVYNSYPANRRMRCIFTPTNTAAPGAGGVAYLNSFSWGNETPCWVFNGGAKAAGEAGSHEIGHTFGLSHDGRITPSEGYFQGHGNWAPIMGVGYYRNIIQWSKGEYNSANQKEDDLAKISGSNHGVGYRNDDFGGSISAAASLNVSAGGAVNRSGIIERTGDLDFFSFTTGGGALSLNVATVTRHPNLDVLLTLYNSSGAVVTTANPSGLPASLSTTLSAGTYYVSVTGTGAGNPATDGYSNYGSLGSYTISGTVSTPSTAGATFYQDCNYGGWAITLPVGSYNLADLQARGIPNDAISSLKVGAGFEVVLYQDINFAGAAYAFSGDFACLVNLSLNGAPLNLNDWATSVVVRATAAAAPGARVASEEQSLKQVTIAEPEEASKFATSLTVAPNPFVNDVVVRSATVSKLGYLYVSIYSLDGKTVLPLRRVTSGESISLSHLTKGVYLIKIFNGTDTETKKIVKY